MLLHVLLSSIFLSGVVSYPARDVDKFPCHKYLDIISDWPDGFRGMLELPVLEDMNVLPDEIKKGDVYMNFNKPIYTLDVPQGDRSKRKEKERKDYVVFIKFKRELIRLRKGDIFSLDISVHFDRKEKGRIGITSLQFGRFLCPKIDKIPPIPHCGEFIRLIDNTPPDGFRAEVRIPVKYEMKGWNMELGFTKELLVLDVPQGIRTPTERNVKMFYIQNRQYNGLIKANATFQLEFMAHFDRNVIKKKDVRVNYIRLGVFECKM